MYSGNDLLILSYIQVLKCKKQPEFPLDSTSPLCCRYGSRCVEAENASQAADCMQMYHALFLLVLRLEWGE